MGLRGWRSASRTRFNPPAIGFIRAPSGEGAKWWDREMSIKDSLVEWISELLSSLVIGVEERREG